MPRKFHYLLLTVVFFLNRLPAAQPLSLHPENPHYFLFRQKPTIIVTSGEHYGAVLNLDFDFEKYLATLAADGLNGTRTWAAPTASRLAHSISPVIPWRLYPGDLSVPGRGAISRVIPMAAINLT